MRQRIGSVAVVVLVAASFTACSRNPVSGRPEVTLLSTQQEIDLGTKEARKVELQVGLVTGHPVVEYVREIGQRLAEHSPRQDVTYTFHVVDMIEPNAFALPGGYVYVSRGLLAFANSEAELANVIGHEIGHVAARHAVQRMTQAASLAPLSIATGLGALATGIVSPALGKTVASAGGLAGTAILAPYNRSQEYEADDIGQRMAAASGWDPEGMPDFLHTLAREEGLSGGSNVPAFLRSHPSTPDRVKKARGHADALAPAVAPPIAEDHTAFLRRLDGLLVSDDPAKGVFEGSRFMHPDLNFTVLFPDGWRTVNAPMFVGAQAKDAPAMAILEIQGDGSDPMDAAREFADAQKIKFTEGPRAVEIGSLPAARASVPLRSRQGPLFLDLTWIVYDGTIFRVTAATDAARAEKLRPVLDEVARSFRAMTLSERQGIQVVRIRLVEARRGETLETLMGRVRAVLDAKATAVANGISVDTPLEEGQIIKVAAFEIYKPSPHPR
jgi:predicted Zn-dependent protease